MAKLRRLVLLLSVVLPFALSGCARETPAEHLANVYAANEMTTAPRYGNLPDYSLPPDKLAKAQHLAKIYVPLHFATVLWSIVQLVLLLWVGAVAAMRNAAARATRNVWLQGYLFLLLFLLATFVLDLPISLYRHSLSLRYGFSIQGWGSWFGDQAKSFAIEWIVGGLLMMLLFWVIGRWPRRWWFVFWLCFIPITLLGIFLTPYVIDPLFSKFEPLQKTDPALVARLEKVVERGHMNIPPDRMFLMKASAKVTTLNAYVTGFGGSKRVVVWDTSLQKGTPDEILLIFGHESGHYVLGHVLRGIVLSIGVSLVLLFLGFHFVQWAIRRFGERWHVPSQRDWSALAVLLLAIALFGAITEPIFNTFSRAQEHAADVYGQEAVHGLIANPQMTAKQTFDVLGENSLDDPNPSPFVEFWTDSHPATGRRAAFGAAYNPWAPGFEPKYFKGRQ